MTGASNSEHPFAVTVRVLDALHVATAELQAAEAAGEPLVFWTHDDRQAAAALSRGLTVRGVQFDGTTTVAERPPRERGGGNA